MTAHARCPHCTAPAPNTPNRLLRATVVAVAWLVSMFFVFASILLGPAIIAVLPLLIPMGIAAISSAHGWAYGDRVCSVCGKLVELDGHPVVAVEPEREPLAPPAIAA